MKTLIFVTVLLVVFQCISCRPQNMNAQTDVQQQGGSSAVAPQPAGPVSTIFFETLFMNVCY